MHMDVTGKLVLLKKKKHFLQICNFKRLKSDVCHQTAAISILSDLFLLLFKAFHITVSPQACSLNYYSGINKKSFLQSLMLSTHQLDLCSEIFTASQLE